MKELHIFPQHGKWVIRYIIDNVSICESKTTYNAPDIPDELFDSHLATIKIKEVVACIYPNLKTTFLR